jgi:hypothetical protein
MDKAIYDLRRVDRSLPWAKYFEELIIIANRDYEWWSTVQPRMLHVAVSVPDHR